MHLVSTRSGEFLRSDFTPPTVQVMRVAHGYTASNDMAKKFLKLLGANVFTAEQVNDIAALGFDVDVKG